MRLQGFENYHELYDWSINQRSLFWEAIVDFCEIQFCKKPEINLIEGVDMERYKKISGVALDNKLIDKNIENGLIKVINNNLIATQRGRIILNTLIKDLLI